MAPRRMFRPISPSPATTRCRRRRSSNGWPAWRPTSSRRSGTTSRPTGAARRSSAASASSRPEGRALEAARPATEADLPRMAGLARTALGELSGERGGVVFLGREARREPIEVSLKAAVADEPDSVHRAWVGTVDDVVVGYLVARIEDLADGRRLGVVEDVFVEEQARGIGI